MATISLNISIAIETPVLSTSYISDLISSIFTENLMSNGIIIDWQYLNGLPKVSLIDIDKNDYTEGDAFYLKPIQNIQLD